MGGGNRNDIYIIESIYGIRNLELVFGHTLAPYPSLRLLLSRVYEDDR